MRIDSNIDGPNNTVFTTDAAQAEAPVGSAENFYGNGFYAKRTKLATVGQAKTEYDGATMRSWDLCNTNKLHPYSGKPSSYKLVSREIPGLMPKPGSLVWKRAGFARHAVYVTKCKFYLPTLNHANSRSDRNLADQDDQLWPAGRHVPQTSGDQDLGILEWAANNDESIDNTNVVLWHTFGVVHFPAPEDFPVMPVEPITLLLRPRNFFTNNPVMDVPPSYCITPSQVAANAKGVAPAHDDNSTYAAPESACCPANGTKTRDSHL